MDVISLSNDLNTKLNLIKSSVKDIQSSIKAKGIDVNNDIRTYAEAINKISGGSSQTSNIKLFSTEEEMRSSTGNNKDDLAVVYGINWLDISPNDFAPTYKLMFPLNITLPNAMGQGGEEINYYMNSVDYAYSYTYIMTSELNTDNTEVVILTVKFQCPELNIDDTIVYKSTDLDFKTFKLYNHDTDYIIDLSAHGIIFQYYNDYSPYLTKYCKYMFNGIYQYKKDQSASDNTYTWQYAETQLTTNLDGPSLDEKFYTNNGVGTANANMYSNMSSYYLLTNFLNLAPKYAISRALQNQLQYFDFKSRYYGPIYNDVNRYKFYILKNANTSDNSGKIQQVFMKSLNHKDISDFIKLQPGNYSSFYITKIKDSNPEDDSSYDEYLVMYTDTTQNKIEFKNVYGSPLDPSILDTCNDIDSISDVDTLFGLDNTYITSSNNIYFIYKSNTSPYTYRLALFTYDVNSKTHNIITISDTDDLVDSDTQTIDPDSFSIKIQESDTTDLITYYYRVNKTDTNEVVHHYSIKTYNKTDKTVNEVATDLYSDIEYSNVPSSIMMINGNTAYIVSTLYSDDGAKMHNRIHSYNIETNMSTLEKSASVDIKGDADIVYSQYANNSTVVRDNIVFDYTSGYLVDLNTDKIYHPVININEDIHAIGSVKGFTLIDDSGLAKINIDSITINKSEEGYTVSMSSSNIIKYCNCNFEYIYNYISDSGTDINAFAETIFSSNTQYQLNSNNHTIVRGKFYEDLEPVYLADNYDETQDKVEGPYFTACGSYGYNEFGKLQSDGNVEFMLPLF